MVAAQVVNCAAHPEQRKRLLAPVVRGESRIALAHYEATGGVTVARRGPADTYLLAGRKEAVAGGADASILLVSARLADTDDGSDRTTLFAIEAGRPGIHRRIYPTLDGMRACDVMLDDLSVAADAVLGDAGSGSEAIRWGCEYGLIAACAEIVGTMDGLLWLTRDYLRQRRQYGVALSSLQALQHRMAEMFAELELSRSMVYQGLRALENPDPEGRHRVVRAAMSYIGANGRALGETALQLHGGIGMANEYKASHYFRRLVTLGAMFESSDQQHSSQ